MCREGLERPTGTQKAPHFQRREPRAMIFPIWVRSQRKSLGFRCLLQNLSAVHCTPAIRYGEKKSSMEEALASHEGLGSNTRRSRKSRSSPYPLA